MQPGHAHSEGQRCLWAAVLLLICAASLLLIALISQGIFERVPHVEDEAAYLFQAQVFAQGRLSVPTPRYPASYWSPFVIDYQGQRFGKYPPGYPLLLSLGVRARMPWIVNALLGSLALWFIAQLGREIYSPTTGLLAAALGLTCPVFLAQSSSLLAHATSLFLTALFLWAVAGLIRDPSRSPQGRAITAGLALGYLIITRPYDAIGLSLPFALFGLARGLRKDRALLKPGLTAVVIALLFGLTLPAYWYLQTGDLANPYGLVWPYDRPGFGPAIGPKGYAPATGLLHMRFNLEAVATTFLGWPGYLNILFLWLPFVKHPRERWNYLLLAGTVSLVTLHLTYWYYGGRDAGFPRYYYASLPMLLLLTARGVEVAATTLHGLFSRSGLLPSRTSLKANLVLIRVLVYLVLAGLVLYNAAINLPLRLSAFRGKSGITAAPLRIVEDAGVAKAIVFVTGYEYWWDFAVFFSANNPTLDSDVVYAIYHNQGQARAVRDLHSDRPCYVQTQAQLLPCPF